MLIISHKDSLTEMDRTGTAAAILSLPTPWDWFEGEERRSLVRLCNEYGAGMKRDQALDDGKPEAGAFMATLIGLAGLEEGIANPLQVVGRDADAGVGDAEHQP